MHDLLCCLKIFNYKVKCLWDDFIIKTKFTFLYPVCPGVKHVRVASGIVHRSCAVFIISTIGQLALAVAPYAEETTFYQACLEKGLLLGRCILFHLSDCSRWSQALSMRHLKANLNAA